MRMKACMLALSLAILPGAWAAADPSAVFDEQAGKLIVPKLRYGDELLYVELQQVPGTLQFAVDESSILPAELDNGNGTLATPYVVDFQGDNLLGAHGHSNHFHFRGIAGQRLVVSALLTQPMSSIQKSRCEIDPGTGSTPSQYDTQIHIYNEAGARVGGICGDALNFVLPATGIYTLNFSYGSRSAGNFTASLQ